VLVRHAHFADGVTFTGLKEYLTRRQLVMVGHSHSLFGDGVTFILLEKLAVYEGC
jgi:hypothetical protein